MKDNTSCSAYFCLLPGKRDKNALTQYRPSHNYVKVRSITHVSPVGLFHLQSTNLRRMHLLFLFRDMKFLERIINVKHWHHGLDISTTDENKVVLFCTWGGERVTGENYRLGMPLRAP